MRRVHVVGPPGAGKSTLAQALAARLCGEHIELDALHWEPGWTPAPPAVFRARVENAVAGECWVVDGNYGQVRDLVWARADSIVWLDFPLWRCAARLVPRTWRRVRRHELLWGTNRESLRHHLSRDSLFLWLLTSHRRRRTDYEAAIHDPANAHLHFVRLRSPAEAARWLEALPASR